ncbi:MAG: TolC family protein [Bacteroidales bacterium]|nr:TolC family protein [Bacteroidales bacterium]
MKTLLITLALLMQAPTDSLPDLSHPWTLQECIDWALEHNLTVATQTITRERTAVEKNTAEWSWVPDASGSVSQNWNFGRGLGGDNTYEYGNSANTGFTLSSSMPLFDGLSTPRRIQLARLNLEAATQDLEKARDDIRVSVAKAYVQVLYNYEIEGVARRQLRIDSLQVARLQGMFDNGKASAADLAQQKASQASSHLTWVQAENNVRSALLDLAQLLDLHVWEGFHIDRPQVELEQVLLSSPDDIFADAVQIRPAIRAEELRLEGTYRSIQIAHAQHLPSLTLSAGLGANYYSTNTVTSFFDQLSNNFSQYVGLRLNVPLFTRFSARNQLRTARLNRVNQEIQLQRVKNNLYKEIVQAWNGAVAAQAKWESAREAQVAAEAAFELQEAKYENGKATFTEFNEARNRLVKAYSDAAQATYEYLFQTHLVEFYRGGALTL